MKRKYCYFVSYAHPNGFGFIEIEWDFKIKCFDDVMRIRKIIQEKNNEKEIVILYWKELKK